MRFGSLFKRLLCILLPIILVISIVICIYEIKPIKPYGVFLSYEGDLESLSDYKTVVIDAQYFEAEDIKAFQKEGHRVISYINIGSLEDFRDYYDTYKDLKLADYEHWEEEIWIDVSDSRWQEFIVGELVPELAGKGIDGFFVDNCDVYYNFPTVEIMNGITYMMLTMVDTGLEVIINGGDNYLDSYCEAGGAWDKVITGINQESVFSKILWDSDEFGTADPEDHKYFIDYIERYSNLGASIYLLEYTTDKKLIKEIDKYCNRNGFIYYISDSLELN